MALNLNVYSLAARIGANLDDHDSLAYYQNLLEAAQARVERYAPGAPAAVKVEAVIRLTGYLDQSDYGGVKRESIGGVREVEYTVNHAAAFRNCGAAGLLSPWKERRAGAIG